MKDNKGFTLIELLAVIIILGVLMIVAIPSVTEYINNSRKEGYVTSVKQVISGVRNKVNSLEYPFLDKEVSYYIPANCVSLEKGNGSPFGDWEDAYIVVKYNGNGYDYFYVGFDEVGYGTELVKEDKLTKDSIEPNMDNVNVRRGINTSKLLIMDKNTCDVNSMLEYEAEEVIDSESGNLISGPMIDIVEIGDFVLYDSGNWDQTISLPTSSSSNRFGGVIAGNSRNSSVKCNNYDNVYDGGWRVLYKTDEEIYIVHAGISECFYHNYDVADSLEFLKSDRWDMYVNPAYAESAFSMNLEILNDIVGNSITVGYLMPVSSFSDVNKKLSWDLIAGSTYYLANGSNYFVSDTKVSISLDAISLMQYNSELHHTYSGVNGIRPVVKLKNGLSVKGIEEDNYGNKAWIIG